ncbi:redoxin domain-containing protein [Dactylosporangium aurantiacum]|uniref:Redoxin domain-containing protein n=1 Tax=Dactylosporangium aurantiacum TaxID=35754 RepID=A0A9Q9MEB9_9ACTN|nr:redoxin domain-containing protein [Dactylosporangium aurantiacum]MDG6107216.1 redoxin domain-containing protein [Dactylosporangium aurantiacum]UWZ51250.1 redoxin domain-containing protein [Dactylosporangium aurantiacum]
MAYVSAALVLVGLVAAVNLLLTFGIVRRLREQTAELAALRAGGGAPVMPDNDVAYPAGTPLDQFITTDVDGVAVSSTTLGSRPLVGFFSPHCLPCKEQLPAFVEHARTRPGGRDGVLAVVVGTAEETAEVVRQLRAVARVVTEPDQGQVQRAFGVTGFPGFILVEDGVVAASNFLLGAVAEHDTAAQPAAG